MKQALIILLFFVFTNAKAQLTGSEFIGKVKNQKGEWVNNAPIKLIYHPTAFKYKLTSDDQGLFYAANINTGGPYTLRVEVPGYRVYEKRQLYFEIGSNNEMDIVLEEITESVSGQK